MLGSINFRDGYDRLFRTYTALSLFINHGEIFIPSPLLSRNFSIHEHSQVVSDLANFLAGVFQGNGPITEAFATGLVR